MRSRASARCCGATCETCNVLGATVLRAKRATSDVHVQRATGSCYVRRPTCTCNVLPCYVRRACPRRPWRYWPAAALERGERQAQPENGEAIRRGESGLCDPRRSQATTGASVRLADVMNIIPTRRGSERSESTS